MASGGALEGRVAIITGGTQGIGEAVVRIFVSEGASVLLVARGADKAERILKELGNHHVAFVSGDVADADTARRAIMVASSTFGHLDSLVNNAAIDYSGVELTDSKEDDIRRVFNVNAIGSILMLREAAVYMRNHGGGSIVNVISRAGLVGIPGMSVYGASKGALVSLTRATAAELAPYGIRVNAVAPGATESPMMRTWIDEQPDPVEFERELVRGLLGQRLADPREVAKAILFLTSSASSYVTGACLPVDGGYTAV